MSNQSYLEWMASPILYNPNKSISHVIDELFNTMNLFVHRSTEIEFDSDIPTLYSKFSRYIYDRFHLQLDLPDPPEDLEMYEYFTSKYSDDIIDLFIDFRSIAIDNGLSLFQKYGDNSSQLDEFLFANLYIQDPYVDSDEELSDIENMDYTIDEGLL